MLFVDGSLVFACQLMLFDLCERELVKVKRKILKFFFLIY